MGRVQTSHYNQAAIDCVNHLSLLLRFICGDESPLTRTLSACSEANVGVYSSRENQDFRVYHLCVRTQ